MKVIFSNNKEFNIEAIRQQYFEIERDQVARLTIVPLNASDMDELVKASKENGSNDIYVADDEGNVRDTFTGYTFMQASKNYQLDSNADIEFTCSVQFA